MGQVEKAEIKVALAVARPPQRISHELSRSGRRDPHKLPTAAYTGLLTVSFTPGGLLRGALSRLDQPPGARCSTADTEQEASDSRQWSGLRICRRAAGRTQHRHHDRSGCPERNRGTGQLGVGRGRRQLTPSERRSGRRERSRPPPPQLQQHEVDQGPTAAGPRRPKIGRSRWRPGPRVSGPDQPFDAILRACSPAAPEKGQYPSRAQLSRRPGCPLPRPCAPPTARLARLASRASPGQSGLSSRRSHPEAGSFASKRLGQQGGHGRAPGRKIRGWL